MGMYDTVILNCPSCGSEYDTQSKGGDCILAVYSFENCPDDVMSNINRHAPFSCECGTVFKVEFTPTIKIIRTNEIHTTI